MQEEEDEKDLADAGAARDWKEGRNSGRQKRREGERKREAGRT